MPARRVLTIVVLAALSLVLAACGSGGGSDARSGGSTLSGAALVRTGLLGFVAIDSDTGSAQWQQLDELAKKFPGRDKALARIERAFTKQDRKSVV